MLTASACDELNAAGIEYFLIDGSLLGAMSIGQAVNTDRDADIGYFNKDGHRVRHALNQEFQINVPPLKAILDLKRYEVNGEKVDRVNAPHELQGVDGVIGPINAWYNSFSTEDILPLSRKVGGTGPLQHCKIPYRAERILEKMFQLPFQRMQGCGELSLSQAQAARNSFCVSPKLRSWWFAKHCNVSTKDASDSSFDQSSSSGSEDESLASGASNDLSDVAGSRGSSSFQRVFHQLPPRPPTIPEASRHCDLDVNHPPSAHLRMACRRGHDEV